MSVELPFVKSIVCVKSNISEQGAEPIYLHVVRPIIKPYTRTLDATLELLLMIGDFVFALATYPLQLALKWWHKRFGAHFEPLETEHDTHGGSSDDVDTSEFPTSFLASSSGPHVELDSEPPEATTVQFTQKSLSEASDADQRQLSNDPRSHNPGSRFPNTLPNRNPEASSSTNPKKGTRHPAQKNSKVVAGDNASVVNSITASRGHQGEGEASFHHQIWYPPRSSYAVDGEDRADLTLRPSDPSGPSKDPQEAITPHDQEQSDEWRQYPAFPSAYPPTPLVVTSRLAGTSIARSSAIYPPIEEERSQQGFQRSLLPPREPLNPSPAGDSSDRSFTFGISPYNFAYHATTTDEADDSMSTDDYEDEDEFNMTLRTPLQPLGSLRSQTAPRRLASFPSGSSAASVPSRLSTLTTADEGSSLGTHTSSESLSASKAIPASVIGKKRSYPRTKPSHIKNRVRQIEIEDKNLDEIADPDSLASPPSGSRRQLNATENPESTDTADDTESSLKSSAEEPDKEQIPPEEKRRKVTRSSSRAVTASRPIVKRYTSPPLHTRKSKLVEVPVTTKRSSSRMKSGSRAYLADGTDASLNTSSSASTSDLPLPPVPLKSITRPMRRR